MKTSWNKGIKEPGNSLNRWGMICLGLFLLIPFTKAAHAKADSFDDYLERNPRYEEYFRSLSDEQQDRIEREYLNQSQYRRAQAPAHRWIKQAPKHRGWFKKAAAHHYGRKHEQHHRYGWQQPHPRRYGWWHHQQYHQRYGWNQPQYHR